MLSVNERILRDTLRDDTMWLRRPELKVEEVFNRRISRSWELLVEVMCGLSEEESVEINKQEDERENTFNQKIDLQSQNVDFGW